MINQESTNRRSSYRPRVDELMRHWSTKDLTIWRSTDRPKVDESTFQWSTWESTNWISTDWPKVDKSTFQWLTWVDELTRHWSTKSRRIDDTLIDLKNHQIKIRLIDQRVNELIALWVDELAFQPFGASAYNLCSATEQRECLGKTLTNRRLSRTDGKTVS
jgi:hypothetical protein